MQVRLIAQGTQEATLEGALVDAAAAGNFNRLDVAVAYATKQGLLTLEAALRGFPANSRWVVGLDDAITQPQALTYLMSLPGAKLRLAQLAPDRRFHPKLYCLRNSADDGVAVSAIGSGNMTLRGLRRNGEAAVLLAAESSDDAAALKAQWETLWSLGIDATQPAIQAYAEAYKKAKKQRAKVVELGVAPPEPEPDALVPTLYDGNVATALNGWMEVGTATQGKEVEIPKPLLPYFRLPAGRNSAVKKFRLPNGAPASLRLIDRKGNAMWRIEFTADVVTAITGRASFYRPNGDKRSEQVVVFKHLPGGELSARAVVLGSADFAKLIAASTKAGFEKRTRKDASGRGYGVF